MTTPDLTDPLDEGDDLNFDDLEIDAGPNWYQYHWHDDMLEDLVASINASGVSLGVTVLLGGKKVTGDLCSGGTYFNAAASIYEQIAGNPVAALLAKKFRERGEIYAPAAIKDDDKAATLYFHMLDVTVDGSTTPVLRGKIAAVDAWWFGREE